ncbi:MAG: phosphatase PAP2 family protein [Patescibacteria group bacterium]
MAKRSRTKHHLHILSIASGGILVAGILFSLILAFLQHPAVMHIDSSLSRAIYELRSPILTTMMLGITSLGDIFLVVGAIFVLGMLLLKRRRTDSLLFFAIMLIGYGSNLLLKDIVERPRPDIAPLLTLSSYSFPSGHAMNAFIFYSFLAYFVYHFTRQKKLGSVIALGCLLLIFLIGFSRVYLGVHYPSDILAGFLAGAIIFLVAFVSVRIVRKKTKN